MKYFCYSSENGLLEFSYTMKVPLLVLKDHNAAERKYKYHVESPLVHRGAISSLEFIAGINARGSVIDRCLKLHVDLNSIPNQCKFINDLVIYVVVAINL